MRKPYFSALKSEDRNFEKAVLDFFGAFKKAVPGEQKTMMTQFSDTMRQFESVIMRNGLPALFKIWAIAQITGKKMTTIVKK